MKRLKKIGYREVWQSTCIDFGSQGTSTSKEEAEASVRWGNERFKTIYHWVEGFCPFTLIWKEIKEKK